MKVLISGATGMVGSILIQRLLQQGHNVMALTRNTSNADRVSNLAWINWDGVSELKLNVEVDAIINLMGENIANRRWSESQKKKIYDSRIFGTRTLAKYILARDKSSLRAFVSASAIGIYPVNTGAECHEGSQYGDRFLAKTCRDWEGEANNVASHVRVVIPRTGVVFGNGGMIKKLLPIFSLGLGGPIGNGTVPMNWIHVNDLVTFIISALEIPTFVGPYNLVTPNPVSNKVFTQTLAKILKRPSFFPVPPAALKLIYGELSTLFLDVQNIIPKRLCEANFQWSFSDLDATIEDAVTSIMQARK